MFILGWLGGFGRFFFLAVDGLVACLADALCVRFLLLLDGGGDVGLVERSFCFDAPVVEEVGSLCVSM